MSVSGNIVLIGLGMVADMHARAIAASGLDIRLHGVLARRLGAAQNFADSQGGAVRVYDDLEQITRDKDVGFALLATPPDARADYVTALAGAGIPILMEKPLERDHARARALVEICEAAPVPLGVVLQHRMRPAARRLAALLAEGTLGRITTVDVRVPWWRDQGYYDAPGRGTYARDGGGVLITQAIHTIDLMLHLCGPVSKVSALTATSDLHRMEAEDFAAATLRFDNGAVGVLVASTTHYPGGAESITLNATRASACLTGDSLVVQYHDGRCARFGADAATGGGADPMAFDHAWHQAVIEDFATALHDARPPAITGRSALPAQALIDAIAAASRSGTSQPGGADA